MGRRYLEKKRNRHFSKEDILWPPDAKSWLNQKRPWCWERLKAREGDDRGWDDWMASPTQWMWVWASSWRWWRTGRPGVLQFMGSQRVGYDWATELYWTEQRHRIFPLALLDNWSFMAQHDTLKHSFLKPKEHTSYRDAMWVHASKRIGG